MAYIRTQGTAITFTDSEATPAAQDVGGHEALGDFESGEATEIDVTNLESTAMEYALGLVDNGTFSLDCILDLSDVGQAAMEAARLSGEAKEMVITLASGDVATFNALVKSAPKNASKNDVWRVVYNFRITGAIAWT